MIKENAILEIRKLLSYGLKVRMHGCCEHKQEEIKDYLEKLYRKDLVLQEYSNGYYLGYLKNNKRHGLGYYVWNSGSIYAGYWFEGEKHDEGINIHENGVIVFAEYSNGKLHGRCFDRSPNGIEVEANYCDGKRTHVFSSSDEFIDRETGIEYNRQNNFSGSSSSGCWGIVFIGILIFILIKMCS